MRGAFVDQGRLFSYISAEARVPANHPLRKIRELVRDVLGELNRSLARLYASEGRPSTPPEQLLSALLLQVFYSIRSERQLMEQLDYNLLYRWFVGLSADDPVWDPTVFTKNRDRLQDGEVFAKFMAKLLNHPQVRSLLSDEHFSVDGTLIEAWASQKSFRPKDGSGDDDGGANFHGQRRKNDTHGSTTDPDCRLYRKAAGREAKLCYMGHATMENRHGLAVRHAVALVPRGAAVDGAVATLAGRSDGLVLRHMRRNVDGAQIGDMIGAVISFVFAHRDAAAGFPDCGLEHRLRSAAVSSIRVTRLTVRQELALLGRAGSRPTWPLLGRKPQAARPSRRRVLHLDYTSPMMDVFPRIGTVATGERSKALQGVVPVSVMGMTLHPGETAQATDC